MVDKKRDVLEDGRLRRLPYSVPPGYFEGLETRLSRIPSGQPAEKSSARSFFPKLAPYLAAAACTAALLVAGIHFASRPGAESEAVSEEYLRYYAADLLPVTRTYISPADEEAMAERELDEDDIREYLISSRTSTSLIAYVLDE